MIRVIVEDRPGRVNEGEPLVIGQHIPAAGGIGGALVVLLGVDRGETAGQFSHPGADVTGKSKIRYGGAP